MKDFVAYATTLYLDGFVLDLGGGRHYSGSQAWRHLQELVVVGVEAELLQGLPVEVRRLLLLQDLGGPLGLPPNQLKEELVVLLREVGHLL